MSIDCLDQARIGQMLLDGGVAGGKRVLSDAWIARMLTPCPLAPFYGYLVWLNNGRIVYPSLPETSWFAVGAGTSIVWIDPSRRAVVVLRWIDSARGRRDPRALLGGAVSVRERPRCWGETGSGPTRLARLLLAPQFAPQHSLYLRPLPQGQRSLRPTLGASRRSGSAGASARSRISDSAS